MYLCKLSYSKQHRCDSW